MVKRIVLTLVLALVLGCYRSPEQETFQDLETEYKQFKAFMIMNKDKIAPEVWTVLVKYDELIIATYEKNKNENKGAILDMIKTAIPMIITVYDVYGDSEKAAKLKKIIQ